MKRSKSTSRIVTMVVVMLIVLLPICASLAGPRIDWKKFKGTQLTFIMNEQSYTEALKKLLPEFEKMTGMKVKFEIYPETDFFRKKMIDATSGAGQYDGGMMADEMPVYAKAKWIEPLDKYIMNRNLIDQAWYDLNDVSPKGRQWFSMDNKLYGIPITFEGVFMFYRKDLFKEKGIKIPATTDELMEAAKKLNDPPNHYGIVMRGSRETGQNVYPWASFFRSFGGEWFDKHGDVAFDSKLGIDSLDYYVKILRNYGPPGGANYGWYECTSDFMQGKAAIFVDASIFAAMLEDPKKSTVGGKIGYAQIPKGPTGLRKTNLWYWSLSINALSKHKEAAALFIAWATSKDTCLKLETEAGGTGGPARTSIWESGKFQKSSGLPAEWFKASMECMDVVDPDCQPKMQEWYEFQNYIGVALSDAIAGAKAPEAALKEAADKTRELLSKSK